MFKRLKTVDSLDGGEAKVSQEVAEFFCDTASDFCRCAQLINHPADLTSLT
jgi:hypothetical protein